MRGLLPAPSAGPTLAIAWSNLAGPSSDQGQLDTAIAYYGALRLAPGLAGQDEPGQRAEGVGRPPAAVACYWPPCSSARTSPPPPGNLASCYYDLGEMDTAIRTFKYALQLEPNFPDAYNNLGNALRETGRLDEAVLCYRTALKLKPDHPHAYNNLGNAMKDRGRVKEAVHCYVTAIRLMPRFAAAHSNLGSLLKEQGKPEQALAHYQEAVALQPRFADAYSNMGNAYKDLGRLQDAIRCYTTAIKARPARARPPPPAAAAASCPRPRCILSAYKDGGQVAEAVACYRRALALRPDFPDAFANLVHALAFVCDWRTREADFEKLSKMLKKQMASVNVLPSVQPFHALVYPLSLAEMKLISQKYAERAKMNVALLDMPPFKFRCAGHASTGYVSSDFGNHPLSHLMQSVFGLHDRRRFRVTCYALSPSDASAWRRRVEAEAEGFKDVSRLGHGDAARLVAADGVDVLVNLNGYTKGARNEIFALRPAPLQVAYLGFCGTLGADYVQYAVVDREVVPAAARPHYSERLLRMPHSYFVNDHRQSARYVLDRAQLPTRAQYGVPEDKFVFCNFNQLYKIDPAIFDTWMAVLKRVRAALLWLLNFRPPANNGVLAGLVAPPADRLHFTNVAPKEEHIKRGHLGDLFLDTPCCNAHTTGCDILWSGTPLLTLPGEKQATRVAASLLRAAGLPELIAGSYEEYEELAVALATDPDRLFAARGKLEAARDTSPLFDTPRWV
ncbi:unnamed protein product, partial [Heterosigma akashiwo]